MSRPKGSKNKKTLLSEAQLGNRIAVEQQLTKKLENEERKLEAQMEELKTQLRTKKKELRSATRTLEKLIEKKEQVDADAANAAQKKEIEKVVSSLVNSGKSTDEILGLLKK